MDEVKQKRLEDSGWKVGTVEEFLDNLTPDAREGAELLVAREQQKARSEAMNDKPVDDVTYKQDLLERLTKPEFAVAYLNAAIDEGDEVFRLAIKTLAEAYGFILMKEPQDLDAMLGKITEENTHPDIWEDTAEALREARKGVLLNPPGMEDLSIRELKDHGRR